MKNYNEEEFLEAIQKIMDRVRKKYSYRLIDGDDIAQEAYFIGLKVMEKYKPEQGKILNFLSVAVGNRIKNLIRDTTNKEIDTCSLDNIQDEYETIGDVHTTPNEFWEVIDEELPVQYRRDYLKMRNGIAVSKPRKAKIIEEIRKIINETF